MKDLHLFTFRDHCVQEMSKRPCVNVIKPFFFFIYTSSCKLECLNPLKISGKILVFKPGEYHSGVFLE